MRTRTNSSSLTATLADLPPGAVPLKWGAWPTPDTRLAISGVPGVWAFYRAVEYGRGKAIELVAYSERGQLWAHTAQRSVASLERVYVVAGEVGNGDE